MDENKVLDLIKAKDLIQLEVLTESGYDFVSLNKKYSLITYLIKCSDIEDQILIDILELFLGGGIEAKVKGKFKKQPIYIAAEKGFKKCYDLLLKYNGDENSKFSPLGLHILGIGKSAKELIKERFI
ncbi:MAG: hypothetical protein CR982_03020 [Candidatus Cloacimonadota bacterium]|nr:MAG: hypothetical protein CR982_03020 [Candidatus Cloacimonadota bacterium]PIE82036.1 MAG: hypothetical protein CSA15_00210 [Candidatus Delongbacteria bacterium]